MNGEERVVSVLLGVDDRCAGILELATDAIGPSGKLVRVDRDADPDGGRRRV